MTIGPDTDLDCYPYTFTPLLLFAQSNYFDRGYSNYNAVARFFSPVLDGDGDGAVDMLENVLYDRKNMMYEELLDYVTRNRMLVICCIDAHFTAFRVIDSRPVSLLYYDPLRSGLRRVSGDGYRTLAAFLLLKCNYGDGQHLQDNRDYYTGLGSNNTRQMIYRLWRRINSLNDVSSLHGVTWKSAPLKLDRYLLVNGRKDPRLMSTQRTGNTCYFQTYL